MPPAFSYPSKPRPGDRVAVLSPSSGLPAVFPLPYELGLVRLREVFALEPVEFPTTRVMAASAPARAADIHAALADDSIAAVIASIGGEDQITVLRHLDPDLVRAHPKPFFGYSDNTNLLIYLWNLGLVGYHGGSVMVQLGRGGRVEPMTEDSLRAALFTRGDYELLPAQRFTDLDRDWADSANLESEPPMQPGSGWTWHGAGATVTGPAWGGCLEIIDFHLRAGRYLLDPGDYAGAVLVIETSEELPSSTYVYRVLMGMGERGMLEQFAAVLVALPKAWSIETPDAVPDRVAYVDAQAEAVLRAIREYNPTAVVVTGLDIGHTDPQLVIPSGGRVTVDGVARRVLVEY